MSTQPDQVKSNLAAFRFLRFIYALCRALVKGEVVWVKDGGSYFRYAGGKLLLVLSVADMQKPNDPAAIGDAADTGDVPVVPEAADTLPGGGSPGWQTVTIGTDDGSGGCNIQSMYVWGSTPF